MANRLLEREREFAAIEGVLDRARGGEGSVLVIEGPPGIGKTALIDEASRMACASGARVLAARGDELELDFPFGAVRQLFEPVLRGLTDDERDLALSGAAGLAAPLVAGSSAAPVTGEDRSFAVMHGLYWLTANLADQAPLLIAVDDLHWTDRPSLRSCGSWRAG